MESANSSMDVSRTTEESSKDSIDINQVCVFCSKSMSLTQCRELGKKAINTLIDASKKRKDKKYKQFLNCNKLKVHKNCYTVYVRQSSIDEMIKKNKESAALRDGLNKAENFDFELLCFICEKSSHNSKKQSFVNSLDTIDCMIEELNNRVMTDADKNEYINKCIVIKNILLL